MRKRVLLVTDSYPPQLGGRAEKVASRVKYLAKYGWKIHVLVPAIGVSKKERNVSPQPLPNVTVHRTPYILQRAWPSLRHDKGRRIDVHKEGLLQILDFPYVTRGYLRWLPYALRESRRLVESVDVVLTMNNPVILHVIGLLLNRRSGKPWVAEFRDPIVGYAYSRRGPEWVNRKLESMIVHRATRVIRWQDFVPDPIEERYPAHIADKFEVIPSVGFDPDDFIANKSGGSENSVPDMLRIAYTGSFYGDTITPLPFLKGLKRFLSRRPVSPESLRVVFAGDWHNRYDRILSELLLQEYVEYLGYLTRTDCISLWARSSVLLLILGNVADNRMRVPSKFWDYLGAGKTILCLADVDGKVARLTREQNLGYCTGPDDELGIAATLEQIWQSFGEGNLKPKPSAEFLAQSTREVSEAIVAKVLADSYHC